MLTRTGDRKMLLFLPPYAGSVFGPPLGLLSLASSLREAGFEPRIVDGAITPDYLTAIERELPGCLAFGVSLLTGPMIADAIAASQLVRRLRPELPIVYGGWHPSLMPGQTLRESYVDIVVLQQGEQTLVEVLQRLMAGTSLDMVAGCWFKQDGRIRSNTTAPSVTAVVLADAGVRPGGFRRLCQARRIAQAALCHQHWLPVRVQLLHRHGVL